MTTQDFRHPPEFRERDHRKVAGEWTTMAGAQALADKLAAAWHAQGYDLARFWPEPYKNPHGAIWYGIASNLVDGMPPLGTRA